MQISAEQRRQAFSTWLRTGWWTSPQGGGGLEYKFNPWHDPESGKFTFAGQGRYFGRGRSQDREGPRANEPHVKYVDDPGRPRITNRAEAQAWRTEQLALHGNEPSYRDAIEARYQWYLAALEELPDDLPADEQIVVRSSRQSLSADTGDGGSFAGGSVGWYGGGASGSWEYPTRHLGAIAEAAAELDRQVTPQEEVIASERKREPAGAEQRQEPQAASETENRKQISLNGYTFEIDSHARTRRVLGKLRLNEKQKRALKTQLAAGGSDRRDSDQGGHYIARRFNGPSETFNHFAQDANFNRSRYFALENRWAKALRSGSGVRVRIEPIFDGESQRPTRLTVEFWIDGHPEVQELPNEPEGEGNAKR